MTADERAMLERRRRSAGRFSMGCLFWALLPMPLSFAACGGCASMLIVGTFGAGAGALASALVGLALGLAMLRGQLRSQRELVADLEAAIADGRVEETACRAKAAALLDEPHPCAFVQLETDEEPRLLYLWGPYLDSMIWHRFPTREFRVVRAAATHEVITVIPDGERLPTVRASLAVTHDEVLEELPDGTVFPGSLETLETDVRAWLAARSDGQGSEPSTPQSSTE